MSAASSTDAPDPATPEVLEHCLQVAVRKLRRDVDAVLRKLALPDGWKWWDWFEWDSYTKPSGIVEVLTVEQYYEVERNLDRLLPVIENSPFHLEFATHCDLVFYINDWTHPVLHAYVQEQQRLRWVRQLVAPDLAAVHREVFDWFAARGDTLKALHWREMEELVAAAFEAQGLKVLLGPGRADRGIDIRLTRHEVFGDVLTAVQVKSGRTPVKLHYVQALAAASLLDGNDESLFVTSARYEPGAHDWVGSWEQEQSHRYRLATADDVQMWCAAARDRIWLPDQHLKDPSPQGDGPLVGRVLMSSSTRLVTHAYGLVVRQTKRAVLMRMLEHKIVKGDIQAGEEVPVLPAHDDESPTFTLLAARRDPEDEHWWGTNGDLFHVWDGRPVYFDWRD